METSIIIRTKNEEKWLGECLSRLQSQTYQDFEILIIDSGSSDKTLAIAQSHQTKIFSLPKKFTYPYASNYGCQKALGEKFFVFLSAHSLPISHTWLENGLKHFKENTVAGIYGGVEALPDASFWEWLFFNPLLGKLSRKLRAQKIIRKAGMGVLGCTNAIIRRDLWEKHPFDERYGNGGEDTAWARYWLEKKYIFVQDPRFNVLHSHGLGIIGLIQQFKHWKESDNPQPFHTKNFHYRKK